MPKIVDDVGANKNLLKHLPEHGVLICKSCQFAIQPSALSSHLLRHQIYRSERRQLLDRLSGLDLRDPEQVTYPNPHSPSISDLPVYRGWICEVPNCGHACASEKRMAQHWSDQHGSREVVARTAWLQTFFRGNKIRYFEVSEPTSAPTPATDDDEEHNGKPVKADNVLASSSSTSPIVTFDDSSCVSRPAYSAGLTATQLNILNLQLMHHWSTTTSHTCGRGTEPPGFWTKTITQRALDGNEYLMYMCLSTAAFHLASEHRMTSKFYQYREIGLEYQGYGVRNFNQAFADPTTNKEDILAFNRLLAHTRCAEHHLDPESSDSAIKPELEGKSLPILECVMLLRGATETNIRSQADLPPKSGLRLPHEVLIGLFDLPHGDTSIVDNAFVMPSSRYPNIPPYLYRTISSIPPRIYHTLYDLNSTDIYALKHAYASLVTCFDRSYDPAGTGHVWAQWNGVEAWPRMVSERFISLLENCHPATVAMLALWSLIVKRLEVHCWYLQGETRRHYRFIREMASGDLLDLVDEIAGFQVT